MSIVSTRTTHHAARTTRLPRSPSVAATPAAQPRPKIRRPAKTKHNDRRVQPFDFRNNPGRHIPAALWSNRRLFQRLEIESEDCADAGMAMYLIDAAELDNVEIRSGHEPVFVSVLIAKDNRILLSVQSPAEATVFHDKYDD